MALTAYLTQTRRLLHDASGQFYTTTDLTDYINIARNQVSAEGKCIRFLPPGTSGVATITVTAPGSGYTTASVSFSGPSWDRQIQPIGQVNLSGGTVQSITIVNPGLGYVAIPPTLTITGDGTGATATATLTQANITTGNQEVYTFAAVNAIIAAVGPTLGIQAIMGVYNVSVSWGTMKPTLKHLTFSDFQAYYRAYSIGLQNYPTIWTQYMQGQNGSIYLWPIPSQQLPMDWDCYCTPIPLVTDGTPEALPYPWTDCVPYYAAMLGYENAQRTKDADRMEDKFKEFTTRARTLSEPPFVPDFYPWGG